MRWLWLTVIVFLAVAMLLFLLQNRDFVTLSFLWFNVRAPFALLFGIAYVVGALTGGTCLPSCGDRTKAPSRAPRHLFDGSVSRSRVGKTSEIPSQ